MDDFLKNCLRTECDYDKNRINPRLVHALLGLQSEVGELADPIKRQMFYGVELDVVNVKEEIGDVLYYLSILMDEVGTDYATEMVRVIEKLNVRYPDKFTQKRAIDRDLKKEREALEDETVQKI